MRQLAACVLVVLATVTQARAEDLVLYGAGSLREAMAEIASTFGTAHGVTVTTQFGPSGRMRERIEKGEHVDVFTSADIGHARRLVQDGRANHFTIVEIWQNREALEAHGGQAHVREFRERLQPMLGAPFDERLHEPMP